MSKIGQAIITIPAGVTVKNDEQSNTVVVTGPQGSMNISYSEKLSINIEGQQITVIRKSEDKKSKSLHGLTRNLIDNAIKGSVKPWEKTLEIVGTGFNGKMEGQKLVLKIGYSHPAVVETEKGIVLSMQGNNTIIVKGMDKQKVGELAHKIKMIRKPDPYKGKGIRYTGEVVKLRAGKKAKAGA